MDLAEKKSGEVTILNIGGRLDATSAAEAEKKLDELIGSGQIKIVLNLGGLEYISSSGLRVFLAQLKKVRKQQGDIRLCCMKPNIREVFDIAGFTQLFNIAEDEAAAAAGFSA
ncbi:MAG: STAS domain-containing protein [Dehalococcoidia bacterium]